MAATASKTNGQWKISEDKIKLAIKLRKQGMTWDDIACDKRISCSVPGLVPKVKKYLVEQQKQQCKQTQNA